MLPGSLASGVIGQRLLTGRQESLAIKPGAIFPHLMGLKMSTTIMILQPNLGLYTFKPVRHKIFKFNQTELDLNVLVYHVDTAAVSKLLRVISF